MLCVTEVLASITVLLLAYWLRKRHFRMTFLQRNRIPGPKPHWIWGNLNQYDKTPNVLWDTILSNKYGSVCGYYLGAKPVILATDLALLDRIQGREGNKFLDRPRRVPGGINPDPKRAQMLGNLQVPQWRVLRGILNKGFSPSRLQHMSVDAKELINVLINDLPLDIGVHAPTSIDFYSLYQNLTLDLITKTGFGFNSNTQQNPNDALKSAVEQEFSKSTSTCLLKFCLCFPEVHCVLQPFRVAIEKMLQRWGLGGASELWDLGFHTVRSRQNERTQLATPPTDLLHLMLSSGRLSETAIVANSVLFFEAGFETLSASLGFITHLLMADLATQQNVRNEIREVLLETGGELENVNKLTEFKLLDAVIKEGLRMYPPQTTFIGRSGSEDIVHFYTTENGEDTCIIPKHTHIQVGLYQILNSSMIWESPREFRPSRFLNNLTAEQAIAYQPFGKGKRICIGRKYADMILKMVFIEVFKKYQIIPVPGKEITTEIEVVYKTATMTPKNGVMGCVIWDPLFPQNEFV